MNENACTPGPNVTRAVATVGDPLVLRLPDIADNVHVGRSVARHHHSRLTRAPAETAIDFWSTRTDAVGAGRQLNKETASRRCASSPLLPRGVSNEHSPADCTIDAGSWPTHLPNRPRDVTRRLASTAATGDHGQRSDQPAAHVTNTSHRAIITRPAAAMPPQGQRDVIGSRVISTTRRGEAGGPRCGGRAR